MTTDEITKLAQEADEKMAYLVKLSAKPSTLGLPAIERVKHYMELEKARSESWAADRKLQDALTLSMKEIVSGEQE